MFVYEIYLYIIVGRKRDILICCISTHYWRPRLCRVFLHSAKSPLHSAKSGKNFLGKGSLSSAFYRGTRQNKKQFCRVLGAALGKIFSAVACRPLTVNLPSARTSTRQKKLFFLKLLCRVPQPRHSAKFFFIFFK